MSTKTYKEMIGKTIKAQTVATKENGKPVATRTFTINYIAQTLDGEGYLMWNKKQTLGFFLTVAELKTLLNEGKTLHKGRNNTKEADATVKIINK